MGWVVAAVRRYPAYVAAYRSAPCIAVLDDDLPVLTLLTRILSEEGGYEVETQSDLAAGYAFVKLCNPDLVILDIMMGRSMSGYDVLECMKSDPTTRDIPVIVSSAMTSSFQHELYEDQAVHQLPKPFDLEDLLRTVRAALLESPLAKTRPI